MCVLSSWRRTPLDRGPEVVSLDTLRIHTDFRQSPGRMEGRWFFAGAPIPKFREWKLWCFGYVFHQECFFLSFSKESMTFPSPTACHYPTVHAYSQQRTMAWSSPRENLLASSCGKQLRRLCIPCQQPLPCGIRAAITAGAELRNTLGSPSIPYGPLPFPASLVLTLVPCG